MSKVSTRPQKAATPVAVAVAVTAATSASPGKHQTAPPEEWRTATIEARDKVTALVQEVLTSEASRGGNNSGRVDRLLGFVLNGFSRFEPTAQKVDMECHAYDAEAALAGAHTLLALEIGSASGHDSLAHALRIMDALTNALSGDEVYPVWDAIRLTPKPVPPARDPLHGHTPKQIHLVLTEIATNASTLGSFLRATRDSAHESTASDMTTAMDMACMMVERVGLLADMPTGGTISGSAADWILGSNFADLGKAVAA